MKKIVVLLNVLSVEYIASFKNLFFFGHLNNKLLLPKITLTLILGPGSAVKKYFFQDYEKREKRFFYMDAYTGLQIHARFKMLIFHKGPDIYLLWKVQVFDVACM